MAYEAFKEPFTKELGTLHVDKDKTKKAYRVTNVNAINKMVTPPSSGGIALTMSGLTTNQTGTGVTKDQLCGLFEGWRKENQSNHLQHLDPQKIDPDSF